jgi:hypothetical protein
MTLQEAKERVTISDLWREFGYEGEPKKQCRCPFHEDRNPSFSVFNDGKGWKCFSGCGEGSVIDFLALAKRISKEEACLQIVERAGGANGNRHFQTPLPKQPRKEAHKLELPTTLPYSDETAQRVADSRGLGITAVKFAYYWLKTIVFARVCEQPSWILTDASGRCAEARRIDRKPFPPIGTLSERKSHTLARSNKSWPVGLLPPGFEKPWLKEHVRKILLVEGGPDYLAACQLIAASTDDNVLPVVMMGASATISQDALPYFAGRRVTIAGHPDKAGRDAALRWALQIRDAGGFARPVALKNGDLCDIVAAGINHNALRLF